MKRNNNCQKVERMGGETTLKSRCRASGRRILARIAAARRMIFDESRQVLQVPERLLRLVLNAAEGAAWQTRYPHLFFPVVATGKVQAVIACDAKRRALPRPRPAF